MKRIAVVCMATVLLAVPTLAEDGGREAALEILKKVDSTIKAVSSVSYEAYSVPTGSATNFAQEAEGKAFLQGWAGGLPEMFYANVKTSRDGDPVEVTGGGDGDSFYVIDHGTKKGYEDMDPGVLGTTGQALQSINMAEFVHDAPYDDELGAENIELLEEAEVNGEACHQIRVVYSGGQGESIWYFSKKDYLPRRRLRKFNFNGEGTIDLVVSNITVNPEFDRSLFKMKLPEGYEAIDDFAP